MSKRDRRWVSDDEVCGAFVQMSKYVTNEKCAVKECQTVLFFNASGADDDDAEFRVERCSCDRRALCCTDHVDTHVCTKCKEDEDEAE